VTAPVLISESSVSKESSR